MRRRNAFTLVELLVVIGIIAVLMSLLLPAVMKAREQALRVACMSNIRQFVMAITNYAIEHRGRYPGPHHHSRPNGINDPFTGYPPEVADLRNLLRPYVKNAAAAFYCPANRDVFNEDRGLSIGQPGWFEGWNFNGTFGGTGFNFVGYAYWPDWTYDGVGGVQTIWFDPEDMPQPKMESKRRVLATDLTQQVPTLPILGYNWYAHGRGGGLEWSDGPKKPQWAARAYNDGSVIAAFSTEWKQRVKLSTDAVFFYW
jgi:prepilin-type N-terminal cleavage/methylation domain-containing protein